VAIVVYGFVHSWFNMSGWIKSPQQLFGYDNEVPTSYLMQALKALELGFLFNYIYEIIFPEDYEVKQTTNILLTPEKKEYLLDGIYERLKARGWNDRTIKMTQKMIIYAIGYFFMGDFIIKQAANWSFKPMMEMTMRLSNISIASAFVYGYTPFMHFLSGMSVEFLSDFIYSVLFSK
jgi:hypothetical protein